jgi:hypothetical protein
MVPGRSNIHCCHRWIQTDPANRKVGKWTAEEDAKLTDAIRKCGKNWGAVAALVPGRTNLQCHQRWVKYLDPSMDRAKGKWTTEEDAKLIDAVTKHGKDWVAVAAMVPGRTNIQCTYRWSTYLDPCIYKVVGEWTAEEDAKLAEAMEKHKHGKDWVAVSMLVPGRTNVMCRRRWQDRPDR